MAQSHQSFYQILGVSPQSTQDQIRDAYRGKSKQCHPDTATIDEVEAAKQFQVINQAYDTLRFPEKRRQYDQWLRQQQTRAVSRSLQRNRIQPPQEAAPSSSAFLSPEDRPLSPGEIFALFILGLTFLFCLLVAIFLGVSRGEMLVQSMPSDSSLIHQLESFKVIPTERKQSSPADPVISKKSSSKMARNYSAAIHQAQQKRASQTSLFPAKVSTK